MSSLRKLGAPANTARRHGRCRQGERLRSGVPHGHRKTTTFVAGLRRSGTVAPMALDGPVNRDAFSACVHRMLAPELRPGGVVVMDNPSSHEGPATHDAIKAAGGVLLLLPPYSPGFNPIEQAFAKLEAHPRKAAERSPRGPWSAIGRILDLFAPRECANHFASAGYDAT